MLVVHTVVIYSCSTSMSGESKLTKNIDRAVLAAIDNIYFVVSNNNTNFHHMPFTNFILGLEVCKLFNH